MEAQIEAACAAQDIPGVVLLATDRSGKFKYSKAIGNLSLEPNCSTSPMLLDSVMWIASCTKLLTTIAALQCVERGLVDLDSDVSPILHELKDIKILTSFDSDGQPTFVKPQNKITLRQLLTHSAGLGYDLFHPLLQKWRQSQGQKIAPGTTVIERYLCPLLYEPGTGWEYSSSIDMAGLLIERVTQTKLQDYMNQYIWSPLGIKDMTFFINSRKYLESRMPVMSYRDPTSGKAVWKQPVVAPPPSEALGGGGIYASPPEYLKVLHAILKDDGTLLRHETVDEMFKPHLSAESQRALMKVLSFPEVNLMMGGLPEGTERSWGLGGLLIMDDVKGWRQKGTLTWGGLPNLTWWIDRKTGICGLYASQILPVGDPTSVGICTLFEKMIYERFRQSLTRL